MQSSTTAAASPKVFWGELAPCEHVLQIYDEDAPFMDSLQGFVGEGLARGESDQQIVDYFAGRFRLRRDDC